MSTSGIRYQSEFALRHIAEGEARGKAEGKAEAVLAVLAARGVDIPEGVRAEITGCTDRVRLDRLLHLAATAEHASDLDGALTDG